MLGGMWVNISTDMGTLATTAMTTGVKLGKACKTVSTCAEYDGEHVSAVSKGGVLENLGRHLNSAVYFEATT